MGTRVQMFATTTGGQQDALASIDVPRNGSIISVSWTPRVSLDTTADFMVAQLSFGSTFNQGNDSRQVISNWSIGVMLVLTAVGAVLGGENYHDQIGDIPVSMGERLFLHSFGAAGVVSTLFLLVEFDFNLDQALVRRR